MPKAVAEKRGGGKAKKDPNAPKRGLSAFMFYSTAQRENVKKNNPGISFGEIGKQLGQQWREMTAQEKAPYEKQAAADKERAEREKKQYEGGVPAKKPTSKKAAAPVPEDDDDDEDDE
ncbi:high mobility group box domain-containing protein [Filobasidium floriforme]|uniref:high mobility group box domain-containing protein n=1 Tax=Filobasidium floriforme TaxID=5210 RepID=UPI001E8E3DCB|nr:high mobility group box domain-containing protein [Filobasidium floriforme]KAH8089269.1 high mobility group box domain-containing protein [Filobasidium floriforme]